jgi:predicted transcriptional regulator
MLMRKRAWDIMRDDVTIVNEDVDFMDLIRALYRGLETDSDNHIAVVQDADGTLQGVISMWNVMRKLEECIFGDETLLELTDQDWDRAFAMACRSCAAKGIGSLVETKVPKVQPNDPLITVVADFLRHRRGWALVCDGDKVLGVIFKADIFKEVGRDVLAQGK